MVDDFVLTRFDHHSTTNWPTTGHIPIKYSPHSYQLPTTYPPSAIIWVTSTKATSAPPLSANMEYRHRCFANSLNLVSNLIEFGQQSHWIWSANSMNLLGNFNDFALLSRWYSCAKELLHVSNESRSSQQINLFCRANQFTLQRKSICFTEQINLLCIRIDCIFERNSCFSTYYTNVHNTVSNRPQTRRQSWLFCGQTRGISASEVKFLCH